MKRVEVKVRVDPSSQDELNDVTERLRRAGLDIKQQLPWGVVIGDCDESRIPDLQQVPGVDADGVSRTRTFRASE